MDFGEYWEGLTGAPIPLGGIAVKKSLPQDVKAKISRILKRSVEFAFANPGSGSGFIRKNAQETDGKVIKSHIELYVNKYSLALGREGRKAIGLLFEKALEKGLIPPVLPGVDMFFEEQGGSEPFLMFQV